MIGALPAAGAASRFFTAATATTEPHTRTWHAITDGLLRTLLEKLYLAVARAAMVGTGRELANYTGPSRHRPTLVDYRQALASRGALLPHGCAASWSGFACPGAVWSLVM
jgi:hypothetical protein